MVSFLGSRIEVDGKSGEGGVWSPTKVNGENTGDVDTIGGENPGEERCSLLSRLLRKPYLMPGFGRHRAGRAEHEPSLRLSTIDSLKHATESCLRPRTKCLAIIHVPSLCNFALNPSPFPLSTAKLARQIHGSLVPATTSLHVPWKAARPKFPNT